jgi:lipopolysaccharide heptosyltransferase II
VLKRCPYIDDMIIYDKNGSHKGIRGILKISAFVRQKNFDIAIDFQNNKTSHLLSWLGAIPQRFGYDNGKWSFFLNKRIKYIKIKASPLDEQFRILRALGIDTAGASRHLEIWPSKEDFLYIESLLKDAWVSDSQVLIGMNIGSSPRWETKRWPLKYFAKLADRLAERDIRVVIVGSKESAGLADEFLRMSRSKPVNAVGMTPSITHLAVLMKRCKLFITGDSAPMHVASSMATPFIAFFGPTDPARHTETSPYITIIRKALKCSPCYRPRCRKHRCMEDISVEEVFKAAMEKLGGTVQYS